MREANGEIFFDPGLAEAGFSVEGKSCRTPSPQHCPAKVSLKWKALCESDLSCKTPTIFVEGELKHSAGPRVLIRKEISPEELAAIGLASHSETRSPVPLNKAPAPKSSLMEAVKSGFRGDSSPSVISFVPAPEAIHKPLLLNPSIHQKQAPPPASLSGGQ